MRKTSNSVLSQYRGALMGISIILIIVFHFTDDCHYYSYHFSGWISFFWRYISSSSVDAFLFFSGLGLYYSMKKDQMLEVLHKKIKKNSDSLLHRSRTLLYFTGCLCR